MAAQTSWAIAIVNDDPSVLQALARLSTCENLPVAPFPLAPSLFAQDRRHVAALPSILLKSERTTLTFEDIGYDKVRVGCSSWNDS
jgi:hypothetical protein